MLPYPSFISLRCNADVIYKLIRRKLTSSTGHVSSSETDQINILNHLTNHAAAPSPFPLTLSFIPLGCLWGGYFSAAGEASVQSQQFLLRKVYPWCLFWSFCSNRTTFISVLQQALIFGAKWQDTFNLIGAIFVQVGTESSYFFKWQHKPSQPAWWGDVSCCLFLSVIWELPSCLDRGVTYGALRATGLLVAVPSWPSSQLDLWNRDS